MIKFLIKEICFDVLFGTAVVKILAGKDAKKFILIIQLLQFSKILEIWQQ